jgi:hypothetical protein
MILCSHADAGFLNKSNLHSCAGAHNFLSEDDPFPRFNGGVLSIAQIIKFVMTSETKSELAALFITACKMIPHRHTLINMGWPQPKSPIQTDNSTAAGVTNNTIVPGRSKMMDMRLWWLHCHASQDQFCYYCNAGTNTGLTTTPNTTQTPTMNPNTALMQAYGMEWALDTHPLARPLVLEFPLPGFPIFLFTGFLILSSNYLSHLGCCRKGV